MDYRAVRVLVKIKEQPSKTKYPCKKNNKFKFPLATRVNRTQL